VEQESPQRVHQGKTHIGKDEKGRFSQAQNA